MKTYGLGVGAVVLTALVLGIVCPNLVSAKNDELVAVGLALLVVYFPAMYYLGRGIYRSATATKTTKKRKETNMKKLIGVLLVVVVFAAMSSIGCSKVPAGNVGVKVYLLGQNKGVDSEELNPGRYWIGINEELYLFPTFTQNYVWTQSATEGSPNDESISFQTREGLSVNADVGISYHINPEKVSTVFQKYRKGVAEITDVYLRNMVRDALVQAGSTRAIESVYGEGKAELLGTVEQAVQAQCSPIGIEVEKISFIGDFRLPESVTRAINAKIEATQKAQQRENEVAEAKAAADKVRAEAAGTADALLTTAKAQAEANKILAASITPELVQYESIRKWSGTMPLVTGQSTPFISLPMAGGK